MDAEVFMKMFPEMYLCTEREREIISYMHRYLLKEPERDLETIAVIIGFENAE